jgi:2,3-bisphosphoglycerate-independent phosphoglycerate mutase
MRSWKDTAADAETTKYAHVYLVLQRRKGTEICREDRVLIRPPRSSDFDKIPEMKAFEIADEVCKAHYLAENMTLWWSTTQTATWSVITGVWDAAVRAVEAVDKCVGKTVEATEKDGGLAIITGPTMATPSRC